MVIRSTFLQKPVDIVIAICVLWCILLRLIDVGKMFCSLIAQCRQSRQCTGTSYSCACASNSLLRGKWEMQLIDLHGQYLITKRDTLLPRPDWMDKTRELDTEDTVWSSMEVNMINFRQNYVFKSNNKPQTSS